MSSISREYAEALFALSIENGCEDVYEKELELVSQVFLENHGYIDFLSSHFVPLAERIDALSEAFSGGVNNIVMSFLKILCEKHHIGEIHACISEYKAMLNERRRASVAKVISAVALNDVERSTLIEKLESTSGRSVTAEFMVDESIIGGLIVEMDGKVMDSSLRKHLSDVKDVIK